MLSSRATVTGAAVSEAVYYAPLGGVGKEFRWENMGAMEVGTTGRTPAGVTDPGLPFGRLTAGARWRGLSTGIVAEEAEAV
jgi:hypothetical protein